MEQGSLLEPNFRDVKSRRKVGAGKWALCEYSRPLRCAVGMAKAEAQ